MHSGKHLPRQNKKVIPKKPRASIDLAPRNIRVIQKPAVTDIAVVTGVTTRFPIDVELSKCLASVACQSQSNHGLVLLIDSNQNAALTCEIELPSRLVNRTWIILANCGSPSRARNAILDFVDFNLPKVRWIGRLDSDDVYAEDYAVEAAVSLGDKSQVTAVLGGNNVFSREGHHLRRNPVSDQLFNRKFLLDLLSRMADGTATNELPSCNLFIRSRSGHRYPDVRSAEDHWLVAGLLYHQPDGIALLKDPIMVNYRLNGVATTAVKKEHAYSSSRIALHQAAVVWSQIVVLPGNVLGFGQEGIVRLHGETIYKYYYPTILKEDKISWFKKHLIHEGVTPAPDFEYNQSLGGWVAQYPYQPTQPFKKTDIKTIQAFLQGCLRQEIVCANIKSTNLRVREDGSIWYVDVGSCVMPMDVSYFRDSATRLHSIGITGAADDELQRRQVDVSYPELWKNNSQLSSFYSDVVRKEIEANWSIASPEQPAEEKHYSDVSLLLKACAMDAHDIEAQLIHLVDQLSVPCKFHRVYLLIDSFEGPFLRQHSKGDLDFVKRIADRLLHRGYIDQILISPDADYIVREINQRWFNVESSHTHSIDGVPVTPQIWAFDQMPTRYVLQADIDVLVGRQDFGHDYLQDMMKAVASDNVTGVAFNIPKPCGFDHYAAPAGEYKPEVRLGLLDLSRIRSLLPLPAGLTDGKLNTTWYRALHESQRIHGLQTLRGGDSRTFYIHPLNEIKSDAGKLSRIRDLVGQGRCPAQQLGRWDVHVSRVDWSYRKRPEKTIVLALGRNTSEKRLRRFSTGLAIQKNQEFGVVAIDDASDEHSPARFQKSLSWLGDRMYAGTQ